MAKAEATVEELVGMIERGELRLPEMQRRYVWRATRVRDLLDSLYRGYPSGAILVWDTDEDVPERDFPVSQERNVYGNTRLLLDGQQRLTSLLAVTRGSPVKVRGRKKPIELLFNLEHPDTTAIVTEVYENRDEALVKDEVDSSEDDLERRLNQMTFVVATRKLERLPHWVRVTDVFRSDSDAAFLKKAGVKDFEDTRYEKYTKRLARLRGIRRYSYRMDVLQRTLSYDEVTEIFVRVNSLGAKLRSSDLALAQVTAKWRNSLKIFQEFQAHCTKMGFDLDTGLLLKCLVALSTGQSRFKVVAGLGLDRLQVGWDGARHGLEFALNFLKANVGITSPAVLSSPFVIVALAYYGHVRDYRLAPTEEQSLRYWVLAANAKGHYSRGSSETILDQDLLTLREGGGTKELVERLRLQVGRLDVRPEDLEGRSQRSALFKTMFLAFQAAKAKDWRSNLAIALDHSGAQHRLQFHHIFPRALMKRAGRTPREIDVIANLSFISGKTNRQISDKEPLQYFPMWLEKNGEAPFDAQCIPTNGALLSVAAYDAFLEERCRLVAKRLNEYLGDGQA